MEKFQLNSCCHHHSRNGLCATLLFAHVPKVGTTTLKAHLNALQEAGTHSLRVVCWHFTHVLLDTMTQLLQATGLVAVSSGLLTVQYSTRWTTGVLESLQAQSLPQQARYSLEKLCFSVEQYVREVTADTAERVGASFLERVQMCLERGGAHFEHMRI